MRRPNRHIVAATAVGAAVLSTVTLGQASASATTRQAPATVYTETNDAAGNAVLAFRDDGAGALTPIGTYPTGGLGTGDGLGSQGAVVLSPDEQFLFAVNAGSDSVSAFAVKRDGGLTALGQVSSGGDRPISVTARRGVGYVLNDTSLNIAGFTYDRKGLYASNAAPRPLSPGAAGPAQVSYTPDGRQLLVSEKTSNTLDVFRVLDQARVGPPRSTPVTGVTPFGFGFTRQGKAVVSEAGTTSAETFEIRPKGTAVSIDLDSNGGQGAPCWVVVTRDGIAFTANAAATANSISSFRVGERGDLFLLNARAAATNLHPTDMALGSRDTRLYNLSDRTGQIDASALEPGGVLTGTAAAVGGLPTTIVGLAATNS